jgi:acetoin utilization deacetylase AcuC-like enzyme
VPEAITWNELRLVHDPAYIEAIASGTLTREMERRIGFPWSTATVERSRRSVGATPSAARAALSGDLVVVNLAGGTHHLAGADPYEGDRLGRLRLTVAGLREKDDGYSTRAATAGFQSRSR